MTGQKIFYTSPRINLSKGKIDKYAFALSVGFLAVALMIGYGAAILPWWLMLAGIASVCVGVYMAVNPVFGLACVILVAFQGVPGVFLRDIPLGSFKAQPHEICFMFVAIGTVWRYSRNRFDRPDVNYSPAFPVLTIVVAFIILTSAIYSRYVLGNVDLALAEARVFLAILLLPMLPVILDDKKSVNTISNVIVASGFLVSCYVLIQMVFGFQMMAGRMEDLELSKNSGVIRTVVGVSIFAQAYAVYMLALNVRQYDRRWLIYAFLLVICIMGIMGTYTRGAWVAIFFGGLVVAFVISRWKGVATYFITSCLVVVVALSLIYTVDSQSAVAMVDRATGIGNELKGGASYGWRLKENELAYDAIASHPLLGVGIGGAYKPVLSSAGSFLNEQYMIHNAYIYFPLKMGLPGLLIPILLFGAYFQNLLKTSSSLKGQSQGEEAALIAGVGTIAALAVSGIEGQTINKFAGLLIFCFILWVTARQTLDYRKSK